MKNIDILGLLNEVFEIISKDAGTPENIKATMACGVLLDYFTKKMIEEKKD